MINPDLDTDVGDAVNETLSFYKKDPKRRSEKFNLFGKTEYVDRRFE